ncbi:MAG: hypothetical protein ACLGHX_08660 [Acidimicrobiia bacterium]
MGSVARPLFTWNHDRPMTDFAHGLPGASDGELLSISHTTLAPTHPRFYRLEE